jgi:hypothetical protein
MPQGTGRLWQIKKHPFDWRAKSAVVNATEKDRFLVKSVQGIPTAGNKKGIRYAMAKDTLLNDVRSYLCYELGKGEYSSRKSNKQTGERTCVDLSSMSFVTSPPLIQLFGVVNTSKLVLADNPGIGLDDTTRNCSAIFLTWSKFPDLENGVKPEPG